MSDQADGARVVVHERAVIQKFDGDPQPGDTPVEVVLVENGQVTRTWTGEEVADAPDS